MQPSASDLQIAPSRETLAWRRGSVAARIGWHGCAGHRGGVSFGPVSRFTGPTTPYKSANSGLIRARDGELVPIVLPANGHFPIPMVTRLKIVVSRVQVPVSPFKNFMQKSHFLSVLHGQISGKTWVPWSGTSRVTARSRIAFPGCLRVSAAEVSIPTSSSGAARRLRL